MEVYIKDLKLSEGTKTALSLNCTPCQGHFSFLVSIILDTPLLAPA